MKTLKELFESFSTAPAKEGEPWVVIINAGYGRQTTWPNADKPGTFSEEEARNIALENNPSSQYAWHAKPLSQALEYVTKGNKCYYSLQDLQMQYEERHDVTEGSNDYSDLEIGDPVIITGRVEFKGSTGEVTDFDSTKSFVVVNLYNHGKHSFHFTDVSYNDYADSDEEEADMYDRDLDEAFPYDVDHMSGKRDIGLSSKGPDDILQKPYEWYGNYDKWYADVVRVNAELLDDNAEFISSANSKLVKINGKRFACWSNRNGNGDIDVRVARENSVSDIAKLAGL